jgi:hypothetical protein
MYNRKITCRGCGKEFETTFSFCPYCGEKSVEYKDKFDKFQDKFYTSQDNFDKSQDKPDDSINAFKKKMFKENRGTFIYIGIILIISLSIVAYQIIPLVLDNLSPKNPVILYLSATIVYLINLYTFQFKKNFTKVIYFLLLVFSIAYTVFFAIMMFEPKGDFMIYIGPIITIVMIFSPFIIGRKNLTIR